MEYETDPDDMEEMLNEMARGTVIDVLPRHVNGNVAIGLSVAIDSLRDKNYAVAIRSLETVVRILKEEHEDE